MHQKQSKNMKQRASKLFSAEVLLVISAFCLFRTSSFNSYLTNFNSFDEALGYISDIPFLIGASVGVFVASVVIFIVSSRGTSKAYSLNYVVPLVAMASAYAISMIDSLFFQNGISPLFYGLIWGLATTTITIVFFEIFAYQKSSTVLIIQLIIGSMAAAIMSPLINQFSEIIATIIYVALPLVAIPLIRQCRKRIVPYEASTKKNDSLKRTVGISSTAILATCFFELITGLVNMYAYMGSSSFTISANAPIQGLLISAAVVALFVAITKKVPNQRVVFLFVFPGIIAAFLLLPFFGEDMGKPLSTAIYSAYLFTSTLSRYWFIMACRDNKTNPYQMSALVGLLVRFSLCVGLTLGWLFSSFDGGETFKNLSILGAVCIYLLGMVVVFWAYRNSREKKVEVVIKKETETFEQTIASQVDTYVEHYGLTGRERDVLIGLAQGNTAASIAEHLCLSTSTVQGYIKTLYAKLNVNKKQQVIDMFVIAEED